MPAGVEAVEIRSPVDAGQYGLAIEDERAVLVSESGVCD